MQTSRQKLCATVFSETNAMFSAGRAGYEVDMQSDTEMESGQF